MSIKMKVNAKIDGDTVVRMMQLTTMKESFLEFEIEIEYRGFKIQVDSLETAASMLHEIAKKQPVSES